MSFSTKRVKIRPPKRVLSDGVDLDKSWSTLSMAISEIVKKNASQLSFEQLYRKCYHLVLRKHGGKLYSNVQEQLKEHLQEKRVALLAEIEKIRQLNVSKVKENNGFMSEILVVVNREWEDHCLSMRMISDVLMYLDRVYVKEQSLPSIYEVGITLFKEEIVQKDNEYIGNLLNNILMTGIDNNRKGSLVDKFLIKSIIQMYESLVESTNSTSVNDTKHGKFSEENDENYYLKSFEPFFMEKSFQYYTQLSESLLELENGTKYLERVNEIIIEEENLSVIYLPKVTFSKLKQLMDGVLIDNNVSTFLDFRDHGLEFWLMNDSYEQLSLLNNVISRLDGSKSVLQPKIRKLIVENGLALEKTAQEIVDQEGEKVEKPGPKGKKKKVSSKEKMTSFAIKWIELVLAYQEKFEMIIRKGFGNDVQLRRIIETSFSEFLNQNSKVSEYLSLYIDHNVKKSAKKKNEEEYEKVLDKAIVVFKFIKDKDVFEKYYKTHLTRRLLQQKYASIDVERSMISKLRQECGSLYISKLQGMFRDIKISSDFSKEFNSLESGTLETGQKRPQFEVNVLTNTYWPIVMSKEWDAVIYPEVLENMKQDFTAHYISKHKGRSLVWAPNFGSLDIRTRFKNRQYEINMQTYAAIVLLLFETHERLSYTEIFEMTQIPEADLKRHLQSISVAPRSRLLKKIPMSKEINDDDVFEINESFENSVSKFKVLTVSMNSKVETDEERDKTMDELKSVRKFEIDAAIVRTMKSRKTLNHNELMAEVIKQLSGRFLPSPSAIKMRIESLLEREYLERDAKDKAIYNYLA